MNIRPTVLYIGLTSDLATRLDLHQSMALIKSFTFRYNAHDLVYYEVYESSNDAVSRERQLKKWNRQKKLELIKKLNPSLKTIYPD